MKKVIFSIDDLLHLKLKEICVREGMTISNKFRSLLIKEVLEKIKKEK